ncbi:MAG: phosphatase PAP2 family protein [Pseudonocardiales bacterium]
MRTVGQPTRVAPAQEDGRAATFRDAAVRLVPAAVLVWALFVGLGYVLTHWLTGTSVLKWDGGVNRWFARHRSGTWNTATHFVTFCAETVTVIGVGLVFFVGMRLALGRWRESVFLAVVLVGEVTIFVCTTFVIDRDRPAVPRLDSAPPTSSFPSGHTAASVALYVGLGVIAWRVSNRAWLRALALAGAVAIPVLVALSRLYRGMHFPSDVLAGALLGALWLAICARVLLERRR